LQVTQILNSVSHPQAVCSYVELTLDQLPLRRWARVLNVARPADAPGRQLALRLAEIGFVPDEPVCVMARGALGGDPLAVRVGQATFALRRHEAALVQLVPQSVAPVAQPKAALNEPPRGACVLGPEAGRG
jgi:ferrous iron transport protein A